MLETILIINMGTMSEPLIFSPGLWKRMRHRVEAPEKFRLISLKSYEINEHEMPILLSES